MVKTVNSQKEMENAWPGILIRHPLTNYFKKKQYCEDCSVTVKRLFNFWSELLSSHCHKLHESIIQIRCFCLTGTAEPLLKWGGGHANEHERCEFVWRSGKILPQKIF